jgi:Tol biopolymer transport system component
MKKNDEGKSRDLDVHIDNKLISKERHNPISKWCLLLSVVILIAMMGCVQNHDNGIRHGIISPKLSPDNKRIIFAYCQTTKNDNACELAKYEIATEKIKRFNPTGCRLHGSPAYSPSGREIVFVAHNTDSESNIFIADADGSNARQVTNTNIKKGDKKSDESLKYDGRPSFSPDGSMIIFQRAALWRERTYPLSGKMLSHWDVYTVDLATGIERRLTNYKFYEMSKPSYLPDGKRFIFSAIGPKPVKGQDPVNKEEYKKQYEDNIIFIWDENDQIFQPAIMQGSYSLDPSVSADGTILFMAVTNKLDKLPLDPYNYDLFIKKSGKTSRLTKMGARILESSISHDGSMSVFLADTNNPRTNRISLWIINTDGTGLVEIKIPWEQLKQTAVKYSK